MREGILLVAFDCRDGLPPDEVPALERPQNIRQRGRFLGHLCQAASPEDLACDGCVEKQASLGGRQGVETPCEDASHRRRKRGGSSRRLAERRGDLLDEERVSACHLDELLHPLLVCLVRERRLAA